jgi:hypothetical protein
MTSESIDPEDTVSIDELAARRNRARDGVDSLQDVEAEQGDESEVDDEFELDNDEARELGVNLDRVDGETPRLD